MRILYVLPSLSIGGMERFVQRVSIEMAHRSHEVGIACTRFSGELAAEISAAGTPVVLCETVGKLGLFFPRALGRHIREWAPDIVHSQSGAWLSAALAAKYHRVPLVHTEHGLPLGGEPRRAMLVKSIAASITAQAVAVSAPLKAHLASLPSRQRLMVIENGVELGKECLGQRSRAREKLTIPENRMAFVVVARLSAVKGIDVLLQALAGIGDVAGSFGLHIIGDGEERESLQQLARTLNLVDVVFWGARDDVQELLPAFDGLVLPSRSEGLPLAVIEAMAQRLPVLTTPVGELPVVLDHGNAGMLTRGMTVDDLAEALVQFAGSAQLRSQLAHTGYQRVATRYSFQRMCDRYEDLYKQLLA